MTMFSYIICTWFLFIALVLCVIFRKKASSVGDCESTPRLLDIEKANISKRPSIPGDSPACHVGDPSNDVLAIEALNLKPNPPIT
jgi:hypothetical protein